MIATEANLEKGLPASLDAEKAILGAIILDVSLFYEADGVLSPEHFYLDAHRRIFARMVELVDGGSPVDIVTITNALAARKEVEAVGGVGYISQLLDGVPHMPSIKQYIRIVRDKATLRGVIHAANNAITYALEQSAPGEEVLGSLEENCLALRTTGKALQPMMSLMQKASHEIEVLQAIPEGVLLGKSTGFQKLDELTTGIRKSELWVIGARPNVGKTPFGMQIALKAAEQECPVAVFSLEMSDLQLAFRCMAHAGCASAWELRDPRRMGFDDTNRALRRASQIAKWPIYVDDTPRLSLRELRAKLRWAVAKLGIELAIVDYLQLLKAPGKNEYEQVSNAATALRELTRETKCPIVVLSQLNRNAKDPEKAPNLGDLRGSGVTEQDANVVVLIHRPPVNDDPAVLSDKGDFILAKVREGVCGPEPFDFDTRSLTFKERTWPM